MSIFQEYYAAQTFVDRFAKSPEDAMDVIIPVYHTNELWRANLVSIYREVPVRRLLISDGGCIDDSIQVVTEFPRVEIYDHRHYKTLGKCISELIREVTAEWFIYLHSDVYLPAGWFDEMKKHRSTLDWFGCPMRVTVLIDYPLQRPDRPYMGSQVGRRAAFFPAIDRIEDDYVYRQEEFIFKHIVEENGFKEGKVEGVFHYHQCMYRPSRGYDLDVAEVNVVCKDNEHEKHRRIISQLCGLIKYLEPSSQWLINEFRTNAFLALDNRYMSQDEIGDFIRRHNPMWAPYFNRSMLRKRKLRRGLSKLKSWIVRKLA